MATTGKGMHRRSRNRLTRAVDEHGKINIKAALQSFNVNDRVVVIPDPSVQKNIPHRRFFGVAGKVIEQRGRSYTVEFISGKAIKYVNILPVHLKKV